MTAAWTKPHAPPRFTRHPAFAEFCATAEKLDGVTSALGLPPPDDALPKRIRLPPPHGCDFLRLDNLVLLCDFHHDVVHKPGWHATFDGNSFTVINPDGRVVGRTVRA